MILELSDFTDVEDLNSIIFCLRRQGKIKDVADELECIAEYAPDSYQIPEILQWAVTGFKPWGSADYTYQERMDTTMVNSIDRELFDRLSVKMIQEPISKNRVVWCYTAAFLAAIAYVQLCKWKTAVNKYPDTYAARYTKMMCDNLCDYSTNWVVRTTYDFQE